MKQAEINLNRKMLADLAVWEPHLSFPLIQIFATITGKHTVFRTLTENQLISTVGYLSGIEVRGAFEYNLYFKR
jgi:hypothetical protein